jgi:integrase
MGGIRVKLRSKKISGGRLSLFLDFYPPIINPNTGKPTRREFLTMTILEVPKSPFDKKDNEETLKIAERIRAKRENALSKPEIYEEFEKERLVHSKKGESDFLEYYLKLANKRQSTNYDNWNSAYKFLYIFTKGSLKFSQVNETFLNDFKDFLLTTKSRKEKNKPLSQNSASSYFNKIKACLKQAQKEGIIQTNLNSKVEPIKYKDTIRQFLTIEEVNLLVITPFKDDVLKRASLFSALTGLRFSDIRNLKWGDFQHMNGLGYQIAYRQQKTKNIEYLPISDQAFEFMGEQKDVEVLVFKGLKYSAHKNNELKQWIKSAGISKVISFHNFRHTWATLQLSLGTDIYTISKMLGHKNIKTTAIYTKIMDENKRTAANRIVLNIPKD